VTSAGATLGGLPEGESDMELVVMLVRQTLLLMVLKLVDEVISPPA
jgi:hypothetical protein